MNNVKDNSLKAPEHCTNIVMVDDEVPILHALERLLIDEPYEVYCFDKAKDALAFCRQNTVALIISDVRMPDMDGIALMAELADLHPLVERVLLTAYSDLEATIGAINKARVAYYVDKPWDDERLLRIIQKGVENTNTRVRHAYLEQLSHEQNQKLQTLNATLEQQVHERTEKLRSAYLSATQALAGIIDQRMHSAKILTREAAILCRLTGKNLGLQSDEIEDLSFAALLGQIGKLGLDDKLLNRAFLDLNAEAREVFEQHPIHAAASLAFIPPLKQTSDILEQHKERIDGSGYPKALKGDEISPLALILGCTLYYLESCEGLYFERALPHQEAVAELRSLADRAFPANVVEALIDALAQRPGDEIKEGERCVDGRQLRLGMTLSRDLFTPNNVLILAKGKLIDQQIIDHLLDLEHKLGARMEIYVIET